MTIAIAGLWELGHNVPIFEAGLWDQPMRDFGVNEWHMTPVTGMIRFPVVEHHTPKDMLDSLRNRFTLVFVSENALEELNNFAHPEHACYVFGKANYSPFIDLPQTGDLSVKIDTANNKAGMWPHQAMSVVLWHRRSQWQ